MGFLTVSFRPDLLPSHFKQGKVTVFSNSLASLSDLLVGLVVCSIPDIVGPF